jgi:hypothetical protein
MGVSGQRHAPAAFYPRGKDPRYHWIGGWVGPRAGLDAETRRKSSAPVGDRTPIVQPVVRHYTAWATAAPVFFALRTEFLNIFQTIFGFKGLKRAGSLSSSWCGEFPFFMYLVPLVWLWVTKARARLSCRGVLVAQQSSAAPRLQLHVAA